MLKELVVLWRVRQAFKRLVETVTGGKTMRISKRASTNITSWAGILVGVIEIIRSRWPQIAEAIVVFQGVLMAIWGVFTSGIGDRSPDGTIGG